MCGQINWALHSTYTTLPAFRRYDADKKKIIILSIAFNCLVILALSNYYLTTSGDQFACYHEDDAQYYTKISDNLSQGYMFTFDQLNRTNGFHPLWATVIAPLHLVVKDKRLFTRIYYIFQYILFIVSSIILYFIICHITGHNIIGLSISLLFSSMPFFYKAIITGLETPLFVFLLLLLTYVFMKYSSVWLKEKRSMLYLLFLFSSSLFLSRLDAGLFHTIGLIVPFFIVNINSIKKTIRPVSVSMILLILLPAIFIAISWYYNGNPIPVSGMMKKGLASGDNYEMSFKGIMGLLDFTTVYNFPTTNRIRTFVSEYLPCAGYHSYYFGDACGLILFSFVMSTAVILVYSLLRYKNYPTDDKSTIYIDCFVFLSIVLAIFSKVNYKFDVVPYYYLATFSISQLLMIAYILQRVFGAKNIIPKVVLGILVIIILVGSALYHYTRSRAFSSQGGYRYWLDSAEWIRGNTQQNTIVASYNSGILGFFSKRIVINLDGKVNSHQYLEEIVLQTKNNALKRRSSIVHYLRRNRVEYFADRFKDCKGIELYFPERRNMFQLLHQTKTYGKYCGKVYRIHHSRQ